MTMTTTMATTRTPDRPRPRAAPVGPPTVLARSLRAETTKLRSLRSTAGSLLAAIVVTVGMAALAAWAVVAGDDPRPADATPANLAGVGTAFGQFALLALAALTITAEFATGSIRTTLAATPARWATVTAKAIIVGVVSFAGGFVATALAILAAAPILDTGTGDLLAASARNAAALALTGLVVLGLGALLRSTAATISSAVAVVLAPAILGELVSNRLVTRVLDHLPSDLAGVVAAGSGEPYGPIVSGLLLGAWGVLILAAGTFALHRRNA
jgi:ABC-2 type transport system permease protein